MEKPPKAKTNLLKFLPKATSAVNFKNIPFSPAREKNTTKFKNRHFSGPIISIIPAEARRKTKNTSDFDSYQEPTSPKVSCMGQIKQKHKQHIEKMKKKSQPSAGLPKKRNFTFRRIFSATTKPAKKSNGSGCNQPGPDRAPSLSQMKKFASGRDGLADFDWTGQNIRVGSYGRNYYSDEESDGEEVIIPFSAPMVIGGTELQPRKEVNLWKRRTMNQPCRLQLKTS